MQKSEKAKTHIIFAQEMDNGPFVVRGTNVHTALDAIQKKGLKDSLSLLSALVCFV